MAGIDFDRQVFVPSASSQTKSPTHLLVPVAAVAALALVAFVGYKVFLVNAQNNEAAEANAQVQQLQEQVAELQNRIDGLERRRKTVPVDPAPSPTPVTTESAPAKTVYRIAAASVQPVHTKTSTSSPPNGAASPGPAPSPEIAGEIEANRQAWEATSNRLADVVGAVGAQQGELSETRDEVNQLLAQTRRQAVSFEINRHNSPVPVGPVTLQLKSADPKGQYYTLCVFFNTQKCIELRDRALNEVVVFIVAKNEPPMELVATRIQRDQIVGYLEVPTTKQ